MAEEMTASRSPGCSPQGLKELAFAPWSVGGGPRDEIVALDRRAVARRTQLILPRSLRFPDWERIGTQLSAIGDSSAWWLGDWLNYGEATFPDRYKRAVVATELDYQTLRNYAWVARKFSPARRRATLSFQHHMEVASLPPGEQDHWLDFAEKMKWSKSELRRQFKASIEEGDSARGDVLVSLQLKVGKESLDRWEAAAAQSSCTLTDWIASSLDKIAELRLSDSAR